MKNKTVFKRVIAVIGRSKLLLFLSLILSVTSVILSLYIPVLAGRAIDGIKLHGNVDFEVIKKCLFGILICAIVGGVLQWVMNIINNRIAYNTVRDIRSKAFSHMQTLPVAFADSHPYGDIVSRITADAEQFADGLILGFSQLFTGIVTIAVTLVFMLTISPLITLAVVVLTPISLFTARFIARRTYSMFKKQSETRGEQTALINEMIQNQKTVQAVCNDYESNFSGLVGVELLPQCFKQLVHTAQLTVQIQPAQQALEAGGRAVLLRGGVFGHTGLAGVAAPFEHGQLLLCEERLQQLLLPELCPGRDILDLFHIELACGHPVVPCQTGAHQQFQHAVAHKGQRQGAELPRVDLF